MTLTDCNAEIIDMGDSQGADRLAKLYKDHPALMVYDTMDRQLEDLVQTSSPSESLNDTQIQDRIKALLKGCSVVEYGNWVFYSWSNRLVHLLPEEQFIQLRTDRNKLKITQVEQDILASKTIGLIGLSVGHAAAVTLALERSFGTLRIADFDELDLSNLNRIRNGVHSIGVPKTSMTARDIAELDPYLNVEVYPEGVTEENMDLFLDDIDLLIDECDSLDVKLSIRERARKRGIPVLMETSDRGMLDVERFDLDTDRPLLHGLVNGMTSIELRGLTNSEKLPYIRSIVGMEHSSPRLKISMEEVGKSISTWPQLGADIMLGGATVAHAARQLLLNEPLEHGRYYLDMQELISEDTRFTLPTY